MSVRIEDDLVARLQGQAGGDDGIALGGVAGEADLLGLHPEKARRRGAGRGEARLEARVGQALVRQHGPGEKVEHGQRGRPEAAGIEIGQARLEREIGAHRPPEGLGVGAVRGRQRGPGAGGETRAPRRARPARRPRRPRGSGENPCGRWSWQKEARERWWRSASVPAGRRAAVRRPSSRGQKAAGG